MESIEQVHVDIYNCDVEYMVINDFLDLINDVLSNAEHKSQIKNEIVNWLKSLNKDQISSFENDPISFIEQWKLKLKELLSQKQLNGFSLNTFNVNDYKNIYGIKKKLNTRVMNTGVHEGRNYRRTTVTILFTSGSVTQI